MNKCSEFYAQRTVKLTCLTDDEIRTLCTVPVVGCWYSNPSTESVQPDPTNLVFSCLLSCRQDRRKPVPVPSRESELFVKLCTFSTGLVWNGNSLLSSADRIQETTDSTSASFTMRRRYYARNVSFSSNEMNFYTGMSNVLISNVASFIVLPTTGINGIHTYISNRLPNIHGERV